VLTVLAEKTEELRQAHNELTRPYFEIAWWGTFGELRSGSGEWPRTVRRRFYGNTPEKEVPNVPEREAEDFVAFLHQHYCPPPVMSQP
jgi:hypothetical protein